MKAFKGFNKDLTCTMGKGAFKYEVGKTYKENEANCAFTGFHCVEEPIEVLTWYSSPGSRYCVVNASGDINEDGQERISCTEMEVVREISLIELAIYECRFLELHPERKYSKHVERNQGGVTRCGFVIVRGKNPKAKGDIGDCLFLLKEAKESKEIVKINVLEVDGKEVKANTYYGANGKAVKK